ncbi:MAG: 30S ribosome-binding factor RbfA [Eubacteriales bacterium]|uniref:30S ribosome-binding factor RbfA n=1 Tax=Fenollaria TaxID=1686313 RepID=UPI0025D06419|nr:MULTISPECIES: 30S ribosome-binding factor RbfA [Fenollaria]MDD7339940.1 30S ribosome-binding factor RbfA [Eubacteriales bacterium]MDY3105621.1 30S ribosome-binding factor RbfA [Fenollaria sp.]
MDKKRLYRLQAEIQRIVSELLIEGLKDPRIDPMTSVSKVELSNDTSVATIYFSIYGSQKTKEDTLDALENAKGYIRSRLAKVLEIRQVPELRFKIDESVEYSIEIQKILNKLNSESEEKQNKELDADEE